MEIYNRLKLNVRYDIAQGSSNDIVRFRTVNTLLEIDFQCMINKVKHYTSGEIIVLGQYVINIVVVQYFR